MIERSRIMSTQIENVLFHFRLHDENFLQKSDKKYRGDESQYHVNHSHMFYEVFYSNGNNNYIQFSDRKINLPKGSFSVIKPFTEHSTFFTGDELFSIGFSFEKSRNALGNRDLFKQVKKILSDAEPYSSFNSREILMLFRQLQEYTVYEDALSDGRTLSVLIMLLYQLFIGIAEQSIARGKEQKPKNGEAEFRFRGASFDMMEKISSLLNADYMEDITPASLSKLYYISPKQINRYFIRQYGQTFLQRRTNLRINAAQSLLRDTAMTISEISEMVGYHSLNTFYSAFKHSISMTPDQYRKETCRHSELKMTEKPGNEKK